MSELVFNVEQEPDGGFVAVAVGESIVTQGDTWDELQAMVWMQRKPTSLTFSRRPPSGSFFMSIRS